MGLKSSMDCQAYADFLTAWEHVVRAYTDFALKGRRRPAGDFLVAKEADRLRMNCNAARDAFMARRCQSHNNVSEKRT